MDYYRNLFLSRQKPLSLPRAIIIVLLACGLTNQSGAQSPARFKDLTVTVTGSGGDIVFIPGLNSAAAVFDEVCAAFSASYRCHLVQLPGFAGNQALSQVEEGFLPVVEQQLVNYIHTHTVQKPIVVGHSLGGFLALKIASNQPSLVQALVIVDSLPFLPATQNPAATAESTKPLAVGMKKNFLSMSDAQYQSGLPMQLAGMSRDQARMPTLTQWSLDSDRATMAQAMYELYSTDLRPQLADITAPVLIFGAWAAYEGYGTTKPLVDQMFSAQYRELENKTILISDDSYHFIMWDDTQWLLQHMTTFLQQL